MLHVATPSAIAAARALPETVRRQTVVVSSLPNFRFENRDSFLEVVEIPLIIHSSGRSRPMRSIARRQTFPAVILSPHHRENFCTGTPCPHLDVYLRHRPYRGFFSACAHSTKIFPNETSFSQCGGTKAPSRENVRGNAEKIQKPLFAGYHTVVKYYSSAPTVKELSATASLSKGK